jgi:hypothetical protein
VGAAVPPIQRQRPRAQDFFELPPALPPTPTPPASTVPTPTSPAIITTPGQLSDDGYESAGDQAPHVNRDRHDGAFAVAQIKELNGDLRGIETELQDLQPQNKAVLVGPAPVRKAQTLSAMMGDAHGYGPYPITNGERTLLSAWLKQGRGWLTL